MILHCKTNQVMVNPDKAAMSTGWLADSLRWQWRDSALVTRSIGLVDSHE